MRKLALFLFMMLPAAAFAQSQGGGGAASSVSVTAAQPNVVINPSPGISTFTVGSTTPINNQTGTTYTVVTGDNSKFDTFQNASGVTVTLPQAGSTGFSTGWSFCGANIGTTNLILQTTTSNINGIASPITETPGEGWCLASDGSNWDGVLAPPPNNTFGNTKFVQASLTMSAYGGI